MDTIKDERKKEKEEKKGSSYLDIHMMEVKVSFHVIPQQRFESLMKEEEVYYYKYSQTQSLHPPPIIYEVPT